MQIIWMRTILVVGAFAFVLLPAPTTTNAAQSTFFLVDSTCQQLASNVGEGLAVNTGPSSKSASECTISGRTLKCAFRFKDAGSQAYGKGKTVGSADFQIALNEKDVLVATRTASTLS